jgi:hypothetical protein
MRHYSLFSLLVVILSLGQWPSGGKTEFQSHHSISKQSNTADRREVIVTTQRNQRLDVFDANTLQSLGYFAVNHLAHSVVASPDGLKLFLELYIKQPAEPEVNGCCALFALDLIMQVGFPVQPGRPFT